MRSTALAGIVGTTLLSHFRSTIDFGGRTLQLAPRGGGENPPARATVLPFWLLGDHFITLEGTAAGTRTMLIFDSGLAMPGGAFVPSASLLEELGVRPGGASVTGVGGGRVTVTPFRFSRLELGPLARTDVVSVAGAFPATLERRFGVRIGGLVSHGFFTGQKVTLDFDRMELIVEGGP
jgi:hypothetical protein